MAGDTDKDRQLWDRYGEDVKPLKGGAAPRAYATISYSRPATPVYPSRIDLHGYRAQEAHEAVLNYLEEAAEVHDEVIVITGASGIIRHEFPIWIKGHPLVRSVRQTLNDGRFYLKLRKNS